MTDVVAPVMIGDVEWRRNGRALRYGGRYARLGHAHAAVFEALAHVLGTSVPRDDLLDVVYPVAEARPRAAHSALNHRISAIRARLAHIGAPLRIVTDRPCAYRLIVSPP